MYKLLMGVSSVLCFVACGSDVAVGGPYDTNGGASSMAGAHSAGANSAGMSSAGMPSAGASGGPDQAVPDPRDAARTYAKKATACQTDADCCLVVDQCVDQGLVVGIADKDKVRALLDSADQSQCLGCIPPFTQVSCEAHVCVGTSADLQNSSSSGLNNELVKDHCGTIQTSDFTPSEKGTVLGCGG